MTDPKPPTEPRSTIRPGPTTDPGATTASNPRSGPKCDPRRALGAEGEALAAAFLARAGYRIAARNVRSGGVELDLVAVRGGLVVIVEVKTRRGRGYGAPEEAVDARKRARLVRGGQAWLRAHRPRARRLRFDVVSCEKRPEGWSVRHLEGAFDAGEAR